MLCNRVGVTGVTAQSVSATRGDHQVDDAASGGISHANAMCHAPWYLWLSSRTGPCMALQSRASKDATMTATATAVMRVCKTCIVTHATRYFLLLYFHHHQQAAATELEPHVVFASASLMQHQPHYIVPRRTQESTICCI